jgi:lipoprotein-anchoring transpeptidase ErfK/SrfK/peptidoglycan hydrolase-like protein with peptidoglycan-binding domain
MMWNDISWSVSLYRNCGLVCCALCAAFLMTMSFSAEAQYRPGTYVDGRPVFQSARRRSTANKYRSRRKTRRHRQRSRPRRIVRRPSTIRRQRARSAPSSVVVKRIVPVRGRRSISVVKAPASTKNTRPLFTTRAFKKLKPVMQIVISLRQQGLTVYEDGQSISRSKVSTGRAGHRTPKGVFSIIQKNRFHRSNIYSGAPMPFMQRITWSGIALHLGRVPGYPASHGCVRLPAKFARHLYGRTRMRTHVVIADGNPVPQPLYHPNLFQVVKLRRQEPKRNSSLLLPTLATYAVADHIRKTHVKLGRGEYAGVSGMQRASSSKAVNVLDAGLDRAPQAKPPSGSWGSSQTGSASPLRILVTRSKRRDHVKSAQRALLVLGYDIGEADGLLGRVTKAAFSAFQDGNGRPATGRLDAETHALLALRSDVPIPGDGHIRVRQNGLEIYSGPVKLTEPAKPLGTHLYTLIEADPATGKSAWTSMTLQAKGRLPDWTRQMWRKRLNEVASVGASEALGRIIFPGDVRAEIERRLTRGLSLIIADRGSEYETGQSTDYVVLVD